jgi:hypothetical protein
MGERTLTGKGLIGNTFSFNGKLFINAMQLFIILYLKFKLSNEKTAFVPRDNVIFYGISLKFMISQCSVIYYNIPR